MPLKTGIKVYLENIDPQVAGKYAAVVEKPEDADYAILRLKAPSQPLEGAGPLGRLFASGDLDFKEKKQVKAKHILSSKVWSPLPPRLISTAWRRRGSSPTSR